MSFVNDKELLPLLVEPQSTGQSSRDALTQWITGQRDWIEAQLLRYGGILLRGFALGTAEDFEQICRLIGADALIYQRIEDLIDELREQFTICIVTHSMKQAARVSQRTAYFHLGNLVEVGETTQIFTNPQHKLTEDYITGRFG